MSPPILHFVSMMIMKALPPPHTTMAGISKFRPKIAMPFFYLSHRKYDSSGIVSVTMPCDLGRMRHTRDYIKGYFIRSKLKTNMRAF